jgi:hypothetical protein
MLFSLELNLLKLEKPGDALSDQYIFTLTDKEGNRYYGVCYRNFFRGISRRYDISRRTKHCICLISRYPYFAFFKVLLTDIFSVGLLEHSRGVCKTFVYQMLQTVQNEFASGSTAISTAELLPFPLETLPPSFFLGKEFKYQIPKPGKLFFKDMSILPIFTLLGVDRFFKVLAAILCEQRVLFISNDVDLLTTTVLGSIAMIYPFRWHHVFITLLPSKLISYLAAPVPYIIGVKKSVLSEVSRELASGVMLVDLDNAEVGANGNIVMLDLVGDSGTALRQATESLDRLKMGVANMFYGKSTTANDEAANQKDLMTMLVLDLKNALSAKPSSSGISGLLRGLPGTSKTYEESKAQWQLESEKVFRDTLTVFFVYLFADLDDFWIGNSGGVDSKRPTSSSSSDYAFHARDYRAKFDLKAFVARKLSNGLSKLLQEFLSEFFHSQMFEKYCEEKCLQRLSPSQQKNRSASTSSTASTTSETGALQDVDDLFEAACAELRYRQLPVNAINAKQAVSSKSALNLGDNSAAFSSAGKINMAGFHLWTLQYTAATDSDNLFDVETFQDYMGNHAFRTTFSNQQTVVLERIVNDLYQSDYLKKIFLTITFRLESLKASSCRGSTALSGVKALQLLAILLIEGPNSALPLGLDLIPLLRSLLKLNRHLSKSSSGFGALEFVNGQYVNPRSPILVVLGLLTDHRRLLIQKSVYLLDLKSKAARSPVAGGKAPLAKKTSIAGTSRMGLTDKKDLFVPGASQATKNFPSFKALHHNLNDVKRASLKNGILKLTVPEKAKQVEEDDENEELTKFKVARNSTNVTASGNNTNNNSNNKMLADDLLEFEVTPPPSHSKAVKPVPMDSANTTIRTAAAENSKAGIAEAAAAVNGGNNNHFPTMRQDSPKRVPTTTATKPLSGPSSSSTSPLRQGGDGRSDSERKKSPAPSARPTPLMNPAVAASGSHKKPVTNAKTADLLEFPTEESPFRLKNLDTGEVMDIRALKQIRQPDRSFSSSKP